MAGTTETKMNVDKAGQPMQAMPLREGRVNLTSSDGDVTDVSLTECVVAGDIKITWGATGNDDTISCLVGSNYTVGKSDIIEIVSGTFHFT